MTSKLNVKEKLILDQEQLRPLKAIVIPKTIITTTSTTSKADTTNGEVYGPHYRGGLKSIISKSISNTGALLYTVKWNDGQTMKVVPNSLRPHYYSMVESFEYGQFQEDEGLSMDMATESDDLPPPARRSTTKTTKRQLRSSGLPLSNSMIDSDDALIIEDNASDSSRSEDDISTRRRRKRSRKPIYDGDLSDTLSVEQPYGTRHQPKRSTKTTKIPYNIAATEIISDTDSDDLMPVEQTLKKARTEPKTKTASPPSALQKLKKGANIYMASSSSSFRNCHAANCCVCQHGDRLRLVDSGLIALNDTKSLLPCRYCTNSTHPACCKHVGAFKRVLDPSNERMTSASPFVAQNDATAGTPNDSNKVKSVETSRNEIISITATSQNGDATTFDGVVNTSNGMNADGRNAEPRNTEMVEQPKLNYHVCKKCINVNSKSTQHKLGDCEKCHKQFVSTNGTDDHERLLFRCGSCERGLCGDCIPKSWNAKHGDGLDSGDSDMETTSADEQIIKKSWTKKICSTCDHFHGRKMDLILTWRRVNSEREPTMTALPIVNATELEHSDQDSNSLPSDDITDYPTLDATTAANEYAFLVKWENESYRHLDWVPGSWLDGMSRKFQSFVQRHAGKLPKPMNEVVPISFKTIDRVLDVEKTESGRIKKVLAKFKGRPYDEVCWDTPPFERALRAPYVEALRYYRMIDKIDIPINMAKRIKEVRSGLNPANFGELREFKTQPPYISNGKLLPHQLDGLNWFQYQWELKQPCILADDMGLGKTIQVVTFLDVLFNRYKIYPFLIVVPNSTATNWVREFNKWAPDLAVVPYFGSSHSRRLAKDHEIFRHGRGENQISCHVVVMTYESALSDLGEFSKVKIWPYIVVDEAQRLKNNESLLFNKLAKVNTDNRILLTGTPLQNNMGELINIMNFTDPVSFDDTEHMTAYYTDLTHQTVQELHRKLKPYFLRRTKDIVLKDLPPKKELIVPLTMTRLQKELYKDHLMKGTKFMAHLRQKHTRSLLVDKSGKPARHNYNNLLMALRKILNHPYLINGVEVAHEDPAYTQQAMVDACGKLKLLHMMLPKLFARGHRVLIFSTMAIALDVLEDYLVAAGINFVRVDGNTSQVDRVAHIDRFNAPDSDVNVFLLTIRAGGVGINLATADTVILYDSDFNPHADLQAISRAHRFGQKSPVLILRLMTRLSVEERILEKCKKKMVLDHLVVDKMDDEELESEDVESILKFGLKALFDDDDDEEVKSLTYSSADVDKLLDREAIFAKESETPEEIEGIGENKEETGAGNMSFSFAKIWQTGERTGNAVDQTDAEDKTNDEPEKQDEDIWEKLLEENQRIAEEEERKSAENLGRGARKRKEVSYADVKFQKRLSATTKDNKGKDNNYIDIDLLDTIGDNEDSEDDEFNDPGDDEEDDDEDEDEDEDESGTYGHHISTGTATSAMAMKTAPVPAAAFPPIRSPSQYKIHQNAPLDSYSSISNQYYTPQQQSHQPPMSHVPLTLSSPYQSLQPQESSTSAVYNAFPNSPAPPNGMPLQGITLQQQYQFLQQFQPQLFQQMQQTHTDGRIPPPMQQPFFLPLPPGFHPPPPMQQPCPTPDSIQPNQPAAPPSEQRQQEFDRSPRTRFPGQGVIRDIGQPIFLNSDHQQQQQEQQQQQSSSQPLVHHSPPLHYVQQHNQTQPMLLQQSPPQPYMHHQGLPLPVVYDQGLTHAPVQQFVHHFSQQQQSPQQQQQVPDQRRMAQRKLVQKQQQQSQ